MLDRLVSEEIEALYHKKFGVEVRIDDPSIDFVGCPACELHFFYPPNTGGEDLYEQLQEFDWYYMDEKWEYNFACKFIHPEDKVLEVGAGRAAFAQHIGKAKYTGLEFSRKSMERARLAGVRLINQSVEQHASVENNYDVVVSFQVLEHVTDPRGFLAATAECLVSGGLLVVSVPSCEGFAGSAVNDALNMPPHHVTRWSRQTLEFIPQILPLKLTGVFYEPIAEYHKLWARRTLIENRIRTALPIRNKLIDRSALGRGIEYLSMLFALLAPWVGKNTSGHTVLAVYEKL